MYGIGRRRSALIAENIVVDAPMPRATARMAIIVTPGVFTSIRQAYLRSRNIRPRVCGYMAEILTNHHSLGCHPIFDHPAVEEMDCAIGVFGKPSVVRDHADRRAAIVQFFEQGHDGLAVARIEVARRFVSKEDRRLARKSARDRDTLLLTTGELAGQMLRAMAHADALQRFEHKTFALTRGHAAVGQRQLDVFVNGQVADEVKALENESDLAVANARAFRERQVRDFRSLERIAAARWRVEQAEDREQCRFAAA